MADRPRALANGDLDLGNGTVVLARDIQLRTSTPGGPGGQHANRTMSRVVVTLDVAHADSFNDDVRRRLLAVLGPTVSASSSSSRSQTQNRRLAQDHLAHRLADALHEDPKRRATRPTKAAVVRRLEGKRRRASIKSDRRFRDEE